jgi:aminodeoxyfutalosine synthase
MGGHQPGMAVMTVLDAVADRVSRGDRLSEEDARAVVASHDLIQIGAMADAVRRRLHGAKTTFVRVFEMHVDAVPSTLPPRVNAGEFRIVGRPTSLEAALAAVRAAVAAAGAVPVTGFSVADLAELAAETGGIAAVAARFADAGLHGVASFAIDAVDDPTPTVRAIRDGGLSILRMTVEHPVADAVALVARATALQREAGGFLAFAPLARTMPVATPTTGFDDVKLIALARLMATEIESIQVDWALYGPKLAQFALTVGADDVDNVAAEDPGILGARRSPIEEIRGNIRAAGLEPVERNAVYEVLGE